MATATSTTSATSVGVGVAVGDGVDGGDGDDVDAEGEVDLDAEGEDDDDDDDGVFGMDQDASDALGSDDLEPPPTKPKAESASEEDEEDDDEMETDESSFDYDDDKDGEFVLRSRSRSTTSRATAARRSSTTTVARVIQHRIRLHVQRPSVGTMLSCMSIAAIWNLNPVKRSLAFETAPFLVMSKNLKATMHFRLIPLSREQLGMLKSQKNQFVKEVFNTVQSRSHEMCDYCREKMLPCPGYTHFLGCPFCIEATVSCSLNSPSSAKATGNQQPITEDVSNQDMLESDEAPRKDESDLTGAFVQSPSAGFVVLQSEDADDSEEPCSDDSWETLDDLESHLSHLDLEGQSSQTHSPYIASGALSMFDGVAATGIQVRQPANAEQIADGMANSQVPGFQPSLAYGSTPTSIPTFGNAGNYLVQDVSLSVPTQSTVYGVTQGDLSSVPSTSEHMYGVPSVGYTSMPQLAYPSIQGHPPPYNPGAYVPSYPDSLSFDTFQSSAMNFDFSQDILQQPQVSNGSDQLMYDLQQNGVDFSWDCGGIVGTDPNGLFDCSSMFNFSCSA
ncbi:hypothetical protein NMY22_g17447 [Coprinellus aureogranulatus]|nr:hypothetical protein NMY22_g17447 [Coprinellus aureogranulatus]